MSHTNETRAPSAWQVGRIVTAVREVLDRIAEQDGGQEDAEALFEALAAEGLPAENYLIRLGHAIIEAERLAEDCHARMKVIEARRERATARAAAMRETMAFCMNLVGLRKFKSGEFTASLSEQKFGPTIIPDEAKVPDDYLIIRKYPDRTKIKDELKAGVVLDFAMLGNPKTTLTIRTN